MADPDYAAPVNKLLSLGEPEVDEWVDYGEFKFTAQDVPALVRMATDDRLRDEGPERESWGPVHAWRALGQVGASEAVTPLTGLFKRIDEKDDDWVGEELPRVFGMIGASAIPALADYLADAQHGEYARISAAHSLSEIGQRHPDARAACVARLTRQLAHETGSDPALKGFVISYLLDLKAVESAAVMEKAFAAGLVDETIAGDWEDIQVALGLLKARLTPPKPSPLLAGLPDFSALKPPDPLTRLLSEARRPTPIDPQADRVVLEMQRQGLLKPQSPPGQKKSSKKRKKKKR